MAEEKKEVRDSSVEEIIIKRKDGTTQVVDKAILLTLKNIDGKKAEQGIILHGVSTDEIANIMMSANKHLKSFCLKEILNVLSKED